MFTTRAFAIMAAVGLAAAQGPCSGTYNIQNGGDAMALSNSGCSSYNGDVVILKNTAGDINISRITSISGDLIVQNAIDLNSLGFDSLQTIGGEFKLLNARGLSTLSFPQLRSTGDITWQTLTNLAEFSFTTGVSSAKVVSITDTALTSLEGLSLSSVDSLTLSANNFLMDVTMDIQEAKAITLTANGADMSASFPKLKKAGDMNFQNLGSLNVPALTHATATLNLESNTFDSVELPKITEVENTLQVADNSALTSVKMPQLATLGGGFVFKKCDQVKKLDFEKLSSIGGNIDFSGKFDEVDLPDLSVVKGAFNVQSTGDISKDCATFQQQKNSGDGVIRGKYFCKGDLDANNVHSIGAGGSGGSGSGSGGDNAGASIKSLTTGALIALSGVLAAVTGLL